MVRMRRGGFRRKGKVPQQWVSCANYDAAVGVTPNTVQAIELCGAKGALQTFDPINIGRFNVQCVTGRALYTQTTLLGGVQGDSWILFEGIAVTTISNNTDLLFDPSIAADAPRSWLWLNQTYLNNPNTIAGPVIPNFEVQRRNQLPNGSFIHTKTKRVIRPDEKLMYIFKLVPILVTGTAAFNVTPFFRTLVRKVA